MDKGILSVKIMILGAVMFLAGNEFIYDGNLIATLAWMAGPVIMLVGLLLGNRKKRDAENESN